MRDIKSITIALSSLAFVFIAACSGDDSPEAGGAAVFETLDQTPILPSEYHNYADITLPNHIDNQAIAQQDNTPNDNPITDAGATKT